jgi:hypothetical protein
MWFSGDDREFVFKDIWNRGVFRGKIAKLGPSSGCPATKTSADKAHILGDLRRVRSFLASFLYNSTFESFEGSR